MAKRKNRSVNAGRIGLDEYIRIQRSLSREEEQERLGPGFHARTRTFDSARQYHRRPKHKGLEEY